MVEEYARAAVHPVGLAVFLDDPEAVELGYGVGAVGVEGGILVLRHLLDLAVELGCRGLVDAAGVLESAEAHGLEDAEHACGVDVGGELGGVERDLDMALGGEVVDLVGAHVAHYLEDRHRVAQIGVVEVEIGASLEVGDALAVVDRRAADGAVDVISLLKQQLRQKRPVLTGDACD